MHFSSMPPGQLLKGYSSTAEAVLSILQTLTLNKSQMLTYSEQLQERQNLLYEAVLVRP